MRRRLITWSLLLAAVSAVLAFVPGFDVLSFYFCLPLSVFVGMSSGSLAVTSVAAARSGGRTVMSGWSGAFKALGVLVVVPLAIILANSVRVRPCDVGYGFAFYAAGPIMSGLFGTVCGAFIATFIRRERGAHLAFYVLFLASFVADGLILFREPAVFFFNPFLGYYPGPIYDDLITVSPAYLWFRAFSLATAVSVAAIAWALKRPDFSLHVSRKPLPWAVLGLSLGTAVTLWSMSGDLGFEVDRDDVLRELDAEVSDGLCDIHYDPEISSDTAALLLKDCGFRHRKAAAFFGLEPDGPIDVFMYRDPDQKARLMGARHVEITKPWLREVHITVTTPGDPVLGHEIAHVVAGRLADNLPAVPVRYGIVPDMAMIEGLAVACSFASDGPSPHEWSLAMILAGVNADPADLFDTAAFVTAQAGRAYTVAGSFIRFIAQRYGTLAIRDLASGRGLKAATGADAASLSAEWVDFLEAFESARVGPDLVNRASGRFSGPGVLGRRCPVDTARLMEGAEAALDRGNLGEARGCVDGARDLDPKNPGLARALARLYGRSGDREGVVRMLDSLPGLPGDGGRPATLDPITLDLVAAADALAFLAFSRGEPVPYRAVAYLMEASGLARQGPLSRAVRARLMAAALPPRAAADVFLVLGGWGDSPADTLAEALTRAPDSPLIHYMLGRALMGEGVYASATDHLLAALELGLGNAEFVAEAEKVLGKAAYWAGDTGLAVLHLSRAMDLAPFEGDRLVIEEYQERVNGD
ncbi:MAG: hypothetical protein GXP54_11625 [Deltaproteobacteria bacterium]|nr:hypothetical protein [Deltaproteobacteria bacterium]